MPGPAQPWDLPEDPRDQTVDLPRIDLSTFGLGGGAGPDSGGSAAPPDRPQEFPHQNGHAVRPPGRGEPNGRGEPPEYLLSQFAKVLRVEREVLYFWTRRMPPDVASGKASPEHVTSAYRAFRRELKGRGGSSGGKKR